MFPEPKLHAAELEPPPAIGLDGDKFRESLHAKAKRAYSWGTMGVGLCILTLFVIGQALTLINSFATKEQVETLRELVVTHKVELNNKIDNLQSSINEVNKDKVVLEDTVDDWLEIQAGRLAAEQERNPRVRAAAAAAGRTAYRKAIDAGRKPMEAFRIGANTYLRR